MAFLTDTFTGTPGTALTSHTGETGGAWTKHPEFPNNEIVISDANRARPSAGFDAMVYASGVPSSANYTVSGVIVRKSANGGLTAICGRMSTLTSTCYYVYYRENQAAWELRRLVDGTSTALGTFEQAISDGTAYALDLVMSGSAISVKLDGATVISVTDAEVTAAGRAGVRFEGGGSNSTGYHVDSLSAADPAGAVTLTIANASHAHTAQSANLPQVHSLSVQGASHGHTAQGLTLTQQHLLAVANASHAHVADNQALDQIHLLAAHGASHSHTVQSPSLTQTHQLGIASTSHGQTASNASILAGNIETPSGRTLTIQPESRAYLVPADPRIYTVPEDLRVYRV